ncbi:MAG TPA: ATP-binding protein [Planctomycetaceae bacterium]|jgi:signal transduction histidine kinase/ActR/RegA family two-component response regulator|nr:ATP-binding protein [Planctomycetaceae bacterium]
MSVDPQVIRSERHREIGDLLQENVGIVIDRWSRRAVAEQPTAARVHHDVLLDHLHALLKTLGHSLKESHHEETDQHRIPALIHGEHRWETGWSLPEVVRDFQILRLVILDFLEEELDRPLSGREMQAIGLVLDESIAASITSYVSGRDAAIKEAEAARAEQDKEIQRRLAEQAAALQEADRRKNEFLAMLSHELRNPLAPIRNAAQILGLQESASSELQWLREVIERQVLQLNRMVDDLLDVSRITQGKFKLDQEPVQLATVIAAALESSGSIITARQHRLHVDCAPEGLWVHGDLSRLIQVVANLLNNAAKYTEVGGEIWLSLKREGEEAVVAVRDTGIGIPPGLLAHIFEPFIQEDRLPDRANGGLGIGLALVRSLVDLHGGRVQAFSDGRGQGSQFVVHLPLMLDGLPSTGEAATVSAVHPAASRRILVVDDSVDSAESLAKVLRVLGHVVHTAYDGQSALEAARLNAPDIVMLDIGMPRMDGFEVARRMRNDPALKDVFLVALTGYGQDEDRRHSQKSGFNAHLVKPVLLDHLRGVLENAAAPSGTKNAPTPQ